MSLEIDPKIISHNSESLRSLVGLSQEELALLTGVSCDTIGKVEDGIGIYSKPVMYAILYIIEHKLSSENAGKYLKMRNKRSDGKNRKNNIAYNRANAQKMKGE